jgi:L-rhamnose mutarotase
MSEKEVDTRWREYKAFTDSNARANEGFLELEEYFHLD